MSDTPKGKRVKCANCDMIYEVYISSFGEESRHCPRCGSNAYDKIPVEWKYGVTK